MPCGSAEAAILAAADSLAAACDDLRFGSHAAFVYNPLRYARRGFAEYVRRYGAGPKRFVLVGMNPGPFGMVQTGVPFGHVGLVRDWMGIDVPIERPAREHPKRPVHGFACTRSEVSGERLWGWARATFGEARNFFAEWFVLNYCPLAFVETGGRNLTPDKLPSGERAALFEACDRALAECVEALEPEWLLGVGAFAAGRAAPLARRRGIPTGAIPHPSPASPTANRGWSQAASDALASLGIELPASQPAPTSVGAEQEQRRLPQPVRQPPRGARG